VAVGLLTGNARAGAHVKLNHFDLHEHFACGGYGDHHDSRDDVAREALADVQRHLGLGVEPSRVWVIGDTPHDVSCARAIGANAVAVLTGWHGRDELARHGPDLLLDDLSDAGPLLAKW
jgi:phosphoglycolate phosphatase-like HAD superfamily hydrolase